MTKKASVINRDPVYRTLQNELRQRVRRGEWSKGSLIPSRRALADEFQVSVPTVQKAVSDMVAEGLLRVNAKRGTYVFGDPDKASKPPLVSRAAANRATGLDVDLRAAVTGHVGLLADVRPGSTHEMASAWPYVIMNEAEHALGQFGIPSRFYNRFDTFRKMGHTSISETVEEKLASSQALVEAVLIEKPIALVFHESVASRRNMDIVNQAVDAGVLVVVVGTRSYGAECITIMDDHQNAGFQAARHLIENGCRRILFFSGYECDWVDTRLQGVREAIERAELPASTLELALLSRDVDAALSDIDDLHPHIPLAHDYAKEVLSSGVEFDGVVAINDDSAVGFIQAAREIGLEPGEDYSIIGFDDNPTSQIMGLSTMHPPCVAMGREAGRAIGRFLLGEKELGSVTLKSRLVVRASSSTPR